MPATSLIGKTRLKLQALAEGVSGGGLTLDAERVKLGYDRALESPDFFGELLSDGPFLIVGTARLDYDAQTAFGPAEVRAILYVGFDRNSAQDFTPVDDFLEALREAWNAADSYGEGEAAPVRIGWEAWRTEAKSDPGIIVVPLKIEFPDPPLPGAGAERERPFLAARPSRKRRTVRARVRNFLRFFVHKSCFGRIAGFSREWLGA